MASGLHLDHLYDLSNALDVLMQRRTAPYKITDDLKKLAGNRWLHRWHRTIRCGNLWGRLMFSSGRDTAEKEEKCFGNKRSRGGSFPTVGEINGINLDNYFANERSFNSVVYIHKKFLVDPKKKEQEVKKDKKNCNGKSKKTKKKAVKLNLDKSVQFNSDCLRTEAYRNNETVKVTQHNDSLLEHTVKFAKNIVPVAIPTSQDGLPVFYTIKTSTRRQKKIHKHDNNTQKAQNTTFKKESNRENSNNIIENYKNDKILTQRDSLSTKVTLSSASQNNTLDEIHVIPSLCCTLSEISEKRYYDKKEHNNSKSKKHDLAKLISSESFEALATEMLNNSGDNKIKIQLMNETDKNLFSEKIRVPIINAVKECLLEINGKNKENADLTIVCKCIECNTLKFDKIMEKLTVIEKKLDKHIVQGAKVIKSPKVKVAKESFLEKSGEDIIEEQSANEEEFYIEHKISEIKKARAQSTVVQITPKKVIDEVEKMGKKDCLESGEDVSGSLLSTFTQLGARPNRVPARFCWIDAAKKSLP